MTFVFFFLSFFLLRTRLGFGWLDAARRGLGYAPLGPERPAPICAPASHRLRQAAAKMTGSGGAAHPGFDRGSSQQPGVTAVRDLGRGKMPTVHMAEASDFGAPNIFH